MEVPLHCCIRCLTCPPNSCSVSEIPGICCVPLGFHCDSPPVSAFGLKASNSSTPHPRIGKLSLPLHLQPKPNPTQFCEPVENETRHLDRARLTDHPHRAPTPTQPDNRHERLDPSCASGAGRQPLHGHRCVAAATAAAAAAFDSFLGESPTDRIDAQAALSPSPPSSPPPSTSPAMLTTLARLRPSSSPSAPSPPRGPPPTALRVPRRRASIPRRLRNPSRGSQPAPRSPPSRPSSPSPPPPR